MKVIKVETKEELDLALALRTEVFVKEQRVPAHLEIDDFEDQCSHFIVTNEKREVIGAGRLRLIDDYAKVERVCIKSTMRGQGIGVKLMERIEAETKALNIKQLVLHAQRQAEAFYERIGYQTVSEEFIDAGIPHVKMRKEFI